MPPGLGKRELDRRQTSAAIRTAALDLFDRDGYDATTVERGVGRSRWAVNYQVRATIRLPIRLEKHAA